MRNCLRNRSIFEMIAARPHPIQTLIITLTGLSIASLAPAMAQSGDPDYYGGLELDEDQYELVLETEEEAADVEDDSTVILDPFLVSYSNSSTNIARNNEDQLSPYLVHLQPVSDGMEIKRGTLLDLTMEYEAPGEGNTYRKLWLFSSNASPAIDLPDSTYNAAFTRTEFIRNWETSSDSGFAAMANIRDNMGMAFWNNDGGTKGASGDFSINTANLKPGRYRVHGQIYRKNSDGQRTNERNQFFNFTVVAAPIYVRADLPDPISTVSSVDRYFPANYLALISDWAVPPFRITLTTDKDQFSLADGTQYDSSLTKNIIDLVLAMPHKTADGDVNLKIEIRDGIGRTASIDYNLDIIAGTDAPEQNPARSYASAEDVSDYDFTSSSDDSAYEVVSTESFDDDESDYTGEDMIEITSSDESDDFGAITEQPDFYYGGDDDDMWEGLDSDDGSMDDGDEDWGQDVTDIFGDPNDASEDHPTRRRKASGIKCGVDIAAGGWTIEVDTGAYNKYVLKGRSNSRGITERLYFDYECNIERKLTLTGATSYIIEEYENENEGLGDHWLRTKKAFSDKDVQIYSKIYRKDGSLLQDYRY
jgi:hypothetical protein